MPFSRVSSTVMIRTVSEDKVHGVFEVSGLYSGYGLTLGNALRRVLLSSLPGAAVTYVKIKNVPHEFSTLPGVKEDIVELMLRFKKLRLAMHVDEPQVLTLKAKGQKAVTAGDIKVSSDVEIVNPDLVLATLTTKNAELDMEITVERGLGYSTVESRKQEKLEIGILPVDAFFSPVVKVHYSIENMRVGERTDYNRLVLDITTDGTVSPSSALHKAASIFKDHFEKIGDLPVKEFEKGEERPAAKKKRGKSKEDATS